MRIRADRMGYDMIRTKYYRIRREAVRRLDFTWIGIATRVSGGFCDMPV